MMHSLNVQITEVERELRMRQRVYPGLVARGKMRPSEAAELIRIMESVLESLRTLQQGGRSDDHGRDYHEQTPR